MLRRSICNVSFCPRASSWKKTCPAGLFDAGTFAVERRRRLAPSDPTTRRSSSRPVIAQTSGDKKFFERIFNSPAGLAADETTDIAGSFIEGVVVASVPMVCDGGKAYRCAPLLPLTDDCVFWSKVGGSGVERIFSPMVGLAWLSCSGTVGNLPETPGKGCETPSIDDKPLAGCLSGMLGTRKGPLEV